MQLRFTSIAVLLVLVSLVPSLAGKRTPPIAYRSQSGHSMMLVPWQGTKVVVLTRDGTRDPRVMRALVSGLDKGFSIYEQITGRDPGENPDGSLNGRDIVAEVPDEEPYSVCKGAACTNPGAYGSEIGSTSFNELYDGIRLNSQYDQAMFYEFGRSFWFYDAQLGTVPTIDTGFAIANRFISIDRARLNGGPFQGMRYAQFKSSIMTDFFTSYLNAPDLTWRNTILLDKKLFPQYKWGTTDLAGAMFYRLYTDSGFAAYRQFWKKLAAQPAAKTPDDAIRNFLVAARSATGRGYEFLFKDKHLTSPTE